MYKSPSALQILRSKMRMENNSSSFIAAASVVSVASFGIGVATVNPALIAGGAKATIGVASSMLLSKLPNVGLKLKELFAPEKLADQRSELITAIENKEGSLLDHANKALDLGVIDQNTFAKAVRAESMLQGESKNKARELVSEIIADSCNQILDEAHYHPSM